MPLIHKISIFRENRRPPKSMVFGVGLFLAAMFFLGSLQLKAQEPVTVAEIFFVNKSYGRIPTVDAQKKQDESNFILRQWSFLRKWRLSAPNRVIIDIGDNHLPSAIGKFSSGLLMEDILKRVGILAAMLGSSELQLDMEAVVNLKTKSKIPLPGANLPYDPNLPAPFNDNNIFYVNKNQLAIVFLYDETFLLGADPRKWPIVGRVKTKNNVSSYMAQTMARLKNHSGAIVLVTNARSQITKQLLEKYPKINAVVSSNEEWNAGQARLNTLSTYFDSGQVLIQAVPFENGGLIVKFRRRGKDRFQVGSRIHSMRYQLPKQIDPEIFAIAATWSKLYKEQKNPVIGYFNRQIQRNELVPLMGRMVQDFHGVEWLGIPANTFVTARNQNSNQDRILAQKIQRLDLNRIIGRDEQIYKFSITGKTLQAMQNQFARRNVYWQTPGDKSIDPDIHYSVALPSSLYYQAFLADMVPEETYQIKTWNNFEETIISYFDQPDNKDQPIAVDHLLRPNPMWRWYWKMSNSFSWKKVDVKSDADSTARPNLSTTSSENISAGSQFQFVFYNTNHRFSFVPQILYSRTEDLVVDNQLLFTVQYENTIFKIKPYLRFSMETLVEYERVKEHYDHRPWISRNAFGVSIPIWLTTHRIGLRMEKDVNSNIKGSYGLEYILDFSQAFWKIFTYVLKSENYLSYQDETDFQRMGADLNLDNSLRVSLIHGLSLVFSHRYVVYRTSEDEKTQQIENNNLKALLMFERAF